MNTKDRTAIKEVRRGIRSLYAALATETHDELEVRLLHIEADLEHHLSKVFCSGCSEECRRS